MCGVREGSLCFPFKNTDLELLEATAMQSSFLRKQMDQSLCDRQILILDCCNSAAFLHNARSVVGDAFSVDEDLGGKGSGRVIITASKSTQYALDRTGDEAGYFNSSLFSRHLIRALETGEADYDFDGRISAADLFQYVHKNVTAEGKGQQEPSLSIDRQYGNVIIAWNPYARSTLPRRLLIGARSDSDFEKRQAIAGLAEIWPSCRADAAAEVVRILQTLTGPQQPQRVRETASEALEELDLARQKAERNAADSDSGRRSHVQQTSLSTLDIASPEATPALQTEDSKPKVESPIAPEALPANAERRQSPFVGALPEATPALQAEDSKAKVESSIAPEALPANAERRQSPFVSASSSASQSNFKQELSAAHGLGVGKSKAEWKVLLSVAVAVILFIGLALLVVRDRPAEIALSPWTAAAKNTPDAPKRNDDANSSISITENQWQSILWNALRADLRQGGIASLYLDISSGDANLISVVRYEIGSGEGFKSSNAPFFRATIDKSCPNLFPVAVSATLKTGDIVKSASRPLCYLDK